MQEIGFGIFETMRAYEKRIVYLGAHLQRLKDACQFLKISSPYSLVRLKQIIYAAVKKNNLPDAYVRLTLWKEKKNSSLSAIVKAYKPYSWQKYKKGFSACISSFHQDESSLLSRIKSTNRIVYELSFQEAKKRGFAEALLLNSRGYLTEGTRSNIFFIKEREIFTPALECGCLAGITRIVVFALAKKYRIKVYTGKFIPDNLLQADEAFLTNSLIGIMPLTSLERKNIGQGKSGSLTNFLMKKYNYLLRHSPQCI